MTTTTNKRFKLSDDSINTFGFRILTSGGDLEQFIRNSVMLYDHDDEDRLPIGRWENIAVEDGAIYADPVFDMKDPFAAQISQKVDDGFIKMASICAVPIEISDDPSVMLPGQKYPTVIKWRAREGSITPIGSNHNALALCDEDGNKIEMNEKSLIKLFDKHKPELITNPPMKEVLKALKLSDTASEAEAVTALSALEQRAEAAEIKLADYEKKETEARKAESIALITAAITEQRLDASAKESTLELFDKNFEAAKIMLSAIPKRQTLQSLVSTGEKSADEKLLTLGWDELDKSGRLIQLKEKHPDRYKELYDEKFKK